MSMSNHDPQSHGAPNNDVDENAPSHPLPPSAQVSSTAIVPGLTLPSKIRFIMDRVKEFKCPICSVPFHSNHQAVQIEGPKTCHHVFGSPCLLKWFRQTTQRASNAYPMCREVLFRETPGAEFRIEARPLHPVWNTPGPVAGANGHTVTTLSTPNVHQETSSGWKLWIRVPTPSTSYYLCGSKPPPSSCCVWRAPSG
jgi:hypothetical protein